MSGPAACQQCGTPISEGDLYCSKCGVDVTQVYSPEATEIYTPDATLAATTGGTPAPRIQATMRQALRDATLGEYEILDELGRGGMATVFRAHDIALDRKVAIKVMAPHLLEGEGMAERFKLEARTAAQLSHPHIIPIYAVKETESTLFFVMKYIEGRALDEIVKKTGALPIPMVRDILGKVGSALGYAHRRDVVHRDVKPGNIMIDEEGTPIVTDFGIAKVAEARGLTVTGTTIGTPSYMSPEQCEAKPVTGASDQYSLGIVAFELLTGKLPFEADSAVTIMYKHCHEPLPPLTDFRPDCPPEILDTVTRMLAKDPADRWPTMEAAMKKMGTLAQLDPVASQLLRAAQEGDLERVAELATPRRGMAGVSGPPTTVPSAAKAPRSRLIAAVAGLVILAGGTLAVLQPWAAGDRTVAEITQPESTQGDPPPTSEAGGGGEGSTEVPAGGSPQPVEGPTEVATATPAVDTSRPAANPPASGGGQPPVERPAQRPAQIRVGSVEIRNMPDQLEPGAVVRLSAVASNQATGGDIPESVIRSCQEHGWSACGYQWSSTDPGVASVAPDGTLTAGSSGRTDVIVSVGGVSTRRTVTVAAAAVASISLSETRVSMNVGDRHTLAAQPLGRSGASLTGRAIQWVSTNPAVATVNADGEVVATAAGSTNVIATSEGARAEATVVVAAARIDARTAIETAIADYARALSARDIGAVRAAYPGIRQSEVSTMENTFAGVDELRASLSVLSVEEVGDRATAVVSSTWVFIVSGRSPQTVQNDFNAIFQRSGGEWRFMERVAR